VSAGAASQPGLGRREQTKQANRAAILDAARDVFADIGYGSASVRDVIRRTGLAAGTFYNYFPDKESVFRALVDDAAVRARARVRAGREGAQTLEAFVRGGYLAYFQFVAEDRTTFALTRRNSGTVRALFGEPSVGAGRDELQADLDAAVAAGLLPPMDTGYTAAAMVGVGFEVGVQMLLRDPVDPQAAADFATSLFVDGLPQ
jgi:AcrR family transcriptional regulator